MNHLGFLRPGACNWTMGDRDGNVSEDVIGRGTGVEEGVWTMGETIAKI